MPIFQLKHLIRGAVHRAHVTRQVDALEIVRFVNDALRRQLPSGFGEKTKAISYKEGVISICVLSSSVRHVLSGFEPDLLRKLRETFPEKSFTSLSVRLAKRFPNDDL